ncbi:MAG TPA: DUF411 domain-containing protein [Gemmatimonadales bacterium]|jgi:hypothetical protein|nr:DUF411 domain-containing protein [Gemmatimonadales bacterium]
MISRRDFVSQAAGLALTSIGAARLLARSSVPTPIAVYKSASCGCCGKWVDYVRAHGFAPTVHDEENMDAIKDDMGVPKGVRSCHTAVVGKYVVEGHVPVEDIRRLLENHPAVAGVAAPGMPASSPGMGSPGAPVEPYQVVTFTADGRTAVFARH